MLLHECVESGTSEDNCINHMSCVVTIFVVITWLIFENCGMICVVIAAHLQQEAQGQSGRKAQQTQIQPVQQTAAQLSHGKATSPEMLTQQNQTAHENNS